MSEIGLWAALVVSAGLYARAAARTPRWPLRRTLCGAAGLAAIVVALLSPLDARAHHSMHAHMVQHLLLVIVAAPLLVSGAPLALALRAGGPGTRALALTLLRGRGLRIALHPVVAVTSLSAAMALTHLPAIYDAALDHPVLHAGEHLLYLVTALLFWTTVLGVRPLPHRRSVLARMLTLLAAMPAMALVGVALMATPRPVYRHYALPDQHGAGRLMWVGGTLPMGALVLALGLAGLDEEERRQSRRDAYAAQRGLR
jgi:putative membrane protein